MEIFLELLIILLLTRVFSEGAERLGQPAAVGELVAGMSLAALAILLESSVPFVSQVASGQALEHVAQMGIFFLILSAGIESKPEELRQHTTGALFIALGGAALPLLLGFWLGWVYLPSSEIKTIQSLLIGVSMSITAIPATIKVLTEFGVLHSRVGQMLVGAALFDDILGLILLALLTSMIHTGQPPNFLALVLLMGKVILFFGITMSLGVHVFPRVRRGLKGFQSAPLEFSVLMGVALSYGLLAEALDMHWILGVFLAGLFFESSRVGLKAYQEIKLVVTAITRGFLGPLFFASIGLQVEFGAAINFPGFMALLILVAFLSKMIGSGLPARWVGLDTREALAVGVGMSSRGAVELVVLGIAAEAGLFAPSGPDHLLVTNLFSALVLMAVVTTLFTPILLKRILPRPSG